MVSGAEKVQFSKTLRADSSGEEEKVPGLFFKKGGGKKNQKKSRKKRGEGFAKFSKSFSESRRPGFRSKEDIVRKGGIFLS